LRAVVQIALEAPARGIAGLDQPRPGRTQLVIALSQLGIKLRDVAAKQPGEEGEGR
jgi:hypothetical protein